MPVPAPSRTGHQIKCGHCHGYHTGARGVFFCSNGPHARANQASVARNVSQPAPVPAPAPELGTWRYNVPEAMVRVLRDGRYATRPDQDTPYTFLRMHRPTHGKMKGCIVVKTQHSERYEPAVVIYPSGKSYFYQNSPRVDMALFLACADPVTAAMAYGRELGRCCRCALKLTDERSRYYSIGPECEKYWPEIIARVNDERGEYYPGIQ